MRYNVELANPEACFDSGEFDTLTEALEFAHGRTKKYGVTVTDNKTGSTFIFSTCDTGSNQSIKWVSNASFGTKEYELWSSSVDQWIEMVKKYRHDMPHF